MTVRRTATLSVNRQRRGSYVHNQIAPGAGKIGVLVALESTGDERTRHLGRSSLCMLRRPIPLR